jgi:hypothetical protein
LLAVNVIGYIPPAPPDGVPLSTPVEALNARPLGRDPDSLKLGSGNPVAVTEKEPAVPTVNVAFPALVMEGEAPTNRVKFCVAFEPTPLDALKLIEYDPVAPTVGVPLRTPVDALKVTPLGKTPDSLRVGFGNPVAVTVNDPAVPTIKVVLLALVTEGGWFTVKVKF